MLVYNEESGEQDLQSKEDHCHNRWESYATISKNIGSTGNITNQIHHCTVIENKKLRWGCIISWGWWWLWRWCWQFLFHSKNMWDQNHDQGELDSDTELSLVFNTPLLDHINVPFLPVLGIPPLLPTANVAPELAVINESYGSVAAECTIMTNKTDAAEPMTSKPKTILERNYTKYQRCKLGSIVTKLLYLTVQHYCDKDVLQFYFYKCKK